MSGTGSTEGSGIKAAVKRGGIESFHSGTLGRGPICVTQGFNAVGRGIRGRAGYWDGGVRVRERPQRDACLQAEEQAVAGATGDA